MKNCVLLTVFLFSIVLGKQAMAQDVIEQKPCSDLSILHQADSIKNLLYPQGFILVKENSMLMESEYEMPVIAPLTQGSWYEIVFISEISSKLAELRMYDWEEKEVVYIKHQWGDVDGTVIRYSYIPKFSEYHMIKPVQVNKTHKKVCGYLMMFKKVDG